MSAVTFEDASNIADVITATATAAGVLVAGVSIGAWTSQRRLERRSEAAANVLVAVRRFCWAVLVYATPARFRVDLVLETTVDIDLPAGLRPRSSDDVARAFDNLEQVELQAFAQLSDSELGWAGKAFALWVALSRQVEAVPAEGPVDIAPATARTVHDALVALVAEARKLQDTALTVLGPIARLETGWWSRLTAEHRDRSVGT